MFCIIDTGYSHRHYRIVRGGRPESGKVLIVQEARMGKNGLRAITRVPCQRVRVLATNDILGDKEVPTLTVAWGSIVE